MSPLLTALPNESLRAAYPLLSAISFVILGFGLSRLRDGYELIPLICFGMSVRLYHSLMGGVVFGNDAIRDHLISMMIVERGKIPRETLESLAPKLSIPHYERVFPAVPILSASLRVVSGTPPWVSHSLILTWVQVLSVIPLYALSKRLVGRDRACLISLVYLAIPRLIQLGFMPIPQTLATSLLVFELMASSRGLSMPLALTHLAVTYTHTSTGILAVLSAPLGGLERGVRRSLATLGALLGLSMAYWACSGLLWVEVKAAAKFVMRVAASAASLSLKTALPPAAPSTPAAPRPEALVAHLKAPVDASILAVVTYGAWRGLLALLAFHRAVRLRRPAALASLTLLGILLFAGAGSAVLASGSISRGRSAERYLGTPAYVFLSLSIGGGSSTLGPLSLGPLFFLDPNIAYSLNPAGKRYFLTPEEREAGLYLINAADEGAADYDIGVYYLRFLAVASGRSVEISDYGTQCAETALVRFYVPENWYLASLNPSSLACLNFERDLVYSNPGAVITSPTLDVGDPEGESSG